MENDEFRKELSELMIQLKTEFREDDIKLQNSFLDMGSIALKAIRCSINNKDIDCVYTFSKAFNNQLESIKSKGGLNEFLFLLTKDFLFETVTSLIELSITDNTKLKSISIKLLEFLSCLEDSCLLQLFTLQRKPGICQSVF